MAPGTAWPAAACSMAFATALSRFDADVRAICGVRRIRSPYAV